MKLCEKPWCLMFCFYFKYEYRSTDLYTIVAQEHLRSDALPVIKHRTSCLKDPCPTHCTTPTPYSYLYRWHIKTHPISRAWCISDGRYRTSSSIQSTDMHTTVSHTQVILCTLSAIWYQSFIKLMRSSNTVYSSVRSTQHQQHHNSLD